MALSVARFRGYLWLMRLFIFVPSCALLASGCVPVFKLYKSAERSCSESFVDWNGGLTHHVVEGEGTGHFAFYNENPIIDITEGNYDLDTGAFEWKDQYIDAAHRGIATYSGIGTLWRNGDLDLDFTLGITYSDGTELTWNVRQERIGCAEIFRYQAVDDEDDLQFITGIYTGGRYEYTHEWIVGSVVAIADGVLNADLSYVETIDYSDGPMVISHTETGDGQGNVSREFVYDDGFSKSEGFWNQGIEGTIAMDYFTKTSGAKKQFWVYHYDAQGNGQGTWEQEGITCDLLFELGDCKRRQCSDDSNGKCAVPVEAPAF